MYIADTVEKINLQEKNNKETWKSHSRITENLRTWERKRLYASMSVEPTWEERGKVCMNVPENTGD